MRTTIDAAGRVVIPRDLRERLGLTGRQEVEITLQDGHVEIEPAPVEVDLVERDGGLVLVARGSVPPLTTEMVREIVEDLRR